MGLVGHVARKGERRDAYRVAVETSGGKRPLERPTHRWKNNISPIIGMRGTTSIIWLRIRTWWAGVSAVMNLRVP